MHSRPNRPARAKGEASMPTAPQEPIPGPLGPPSPVEMPQPAPPLGVPAPTPDTIAPGEPQGIPPGSPPEEPPLPNPEPSREQ